MDGLYFVKNNNILYLKKLKVINKIIFLNKMAPQQNESSQSFQPTDPLNDFRFLIIEKQGIIEDKRGNLSIGTLSNSSDGGTSSDSDEEETEQDNSQETSSCVVLEKQPIRKPIIHGVAPNGQLLSLREAQQRMLLTDGFFGKKPKQNN